MQSKQDETEQLDPLDSPERVPTLSLLPPNTQDVNTLRIATVCAFLVPAAFTAVAYFYREHLFKSVDFMLVLAIASLVIIPILCVVYFYAYRFYEDSFYLLIATGWFLNVVYICSETFLPALRHQVEYRLIVVLLSVFSFAPFYIAIFVKDGSIKIRKLVRATSALLAWLLLVLAAFIKVGPIASWNKDTVQFAVAAIGAIPFTAITLFALGNCFRSRLGPTGHTRWARFLTLTFRVFGVLQVAYILNLFSGTETYVTSVFFFALLLKGANGLSIGAIMLHDNNRRLQEMVDKQRSEERTVLEEIGTLTAAIEHELRNPLGDMETEIDRMKTRFQAQSEVLSGLDNLEEHRQRMVAAARIIPVLRGGSDFYEKHMGRIGLRSLIRRSADAVEGEMITTNILFKIGEGNFYTKANARILEQAFVNVLKNAVEAIREARRDQGRVRVEMHSDPDSIGMIRVDIADNGCGIPEEDLPKVRALSLFTTKKDKKPNSGIGLYVTARILRLHQGRFEIDSVFGKGTTVSLFLPKWVDEPKKSQGSL